MKKALVILINALLLLFLGFFLLEANNTHYTFVYVKSESMTASGIYKGSTYLVKKKDKYEVNDIIAFNTKNNIIYFHEIIRINEDNTFITKGSSNALPDSGSVSADKVIGALTSKRAYNIVTNIPLLISGIIIIYLLILTFIGVTVVKLKKDDSTTSGNIFYIIILLIILILGCLYVAKPGWSASNLNVNCSVNVEYSYYKSPFITNDEGVIIGVDTNFKEPIVYIPEKDETGTPITEVENFVIANNNSIEVLVIPASVTSLGWLNFFNCPKLKTIILEAENPITSWTSIFGGQLDSSVRIYVPDAAYDTYRKAGGWKLYKKQIYPVSSYQGEY